MLKYSIIVPIYNAEKYLRQCLESILVQKGADFELLLIDDDSKDASLQICNQYAAKNPHVRVFHQQQNMGVSAARNLGIQQACGEYVLFVDSDDFVAPEYLCIINEAVNENVFDLISWQNYDYIESSDGITEIKASRLTYTAREANPSAKAWHDLFLYSFFASSWNKLFLLSILRDNNIQFDTQCVCYEDYLFNMAYCSHISSFCVLNRSLYYYRQLDSSNTILKRKWGKRFDVSRKVAAATNAFIERHHNEPILTNLQRFPYHSYMVELQASYLTAPDSFYNETKELLTDNLFKNAVCSVQPAGKRLSLLKIIMRLHLNRVGAALLRIAVSRDVKH